MLDDDTQHSVMPKMRQSGDPAKVASSLTRHERIFLTQHDDPLQVSTPYAKRHLHVVVFRQLIRKHLINYRLIDSAYTEFLHDTFGDATVSAYWVALSSFGLEVRDVMITTQRARVEAAVRTLVEQPWAGISAPHVVAADIHQVILGMGINCRAIPAPAQRAIHVDAEEARLFVTVHYGETNRVTHISVRPCVSMRRAATFYVRKG